jgi:hypothetical protein
MSKSTTLFMVMPPEPTDDSTDRRLGRGRTDRSDDGFTVGG